MVDRQRVDEMYRDLVGHPSGGDQLPVTFPAAAIGVVLTAGAAGWAYGAAPVELVPVTNAYRLKCIGIICNGPSVADDFEVKILAGTTAKATVPVSFTTAVGGGAFVPFVEPIYLEPLTQILGNLACKDAVARTLSVKLLCTRMPAGS